MSERDIRTEHARRTEYLRQHYSDQVYCLDCHDYIEGEHYAGHKKMHLAQQIEAARADGRATASAVERWLKANQSSRRNKE